MKNETVFQFSEAGFGEDLVAALTQAGYSNTRSRRAVLEALASAAGPATPVELLELGRQRHPALGQVTVYRTLELLEELGMVRKLHLAEGCHSFVLTTVRPAAEDEHSDAAGGHGHHVICQQCHRAVEFAGCDIDAVVAAVQAQTGFAIQSHWLEMFGLCPSCQEKLS